jgi:hypothetical protein
VKFPEPPDTDRLINFLCFVLAAVLAATAHFYPAERDSLEKFATLSAGAALRGMGSEH